MEWSSSQQQLAKAPQGEGEGLYSGLLNGRLAVSPHLPLHRAAGMFIQGARLQPLCHLPCALCPAPTRFCISGIQTPRACSCIEPGRMHARGGKSPCACAPGVLLTHPSPPHPLGLGLATMSPLPSGPCRPSLTHLPCLDRTGAALQRRVPTRVSTTCQLMQIVFATSCLCM